MALNKGSPVPLYYQLAEQIKEQISQGKRNPGDQIPSERQLSEEHGISRMTARQAISYLVREGTLVAKKGLGTFVAEPKLTYDALHLLGFTEEIMRLGGMVVSRVIEQSVVTPPPRVAASLALAPDDTAARIVRLRLAGETPLLLETIYVPTAICPGLESEDLASQSLYAVIEGRYGLRLKHARQALESTIANNYEAGLFDIAPGSAMILLEGVTSDEQGRPVEHFKAIYRGDRFKFTFESERNIWAYDGPGAPRVGVVLA